MATANQESGYLTPENTRVFYDAANDVVRITIADDAFGPEGLSTVLKKDSRADLIARKALSAHSINARPHELDFSQLPAQATPVKIKVGEHSLDWQVGTDSQGKPVIFSFEGEEGHLLIAGSSGTGKTPLLFTMIEQLVSRQCQLWLVDPVDGRNSSLSVFAGSPAVRHLIRGNRLLAQTSELMDRAVQEMHRRFGQQRAAGVKRMDKLRALKAAAGDPNAPLDPIVIVIDDSFAVLGDPSNRQEAEATQSILTSCTELARKARSADIHLVLTTQYPTNAAMPSVIRQQCQRIGLRVQSTMASRVIIEQSGLERIDREGVGVLLAEHEATPFIVLPSTTWKL